jgi:hypothetical protein
MISSYNRYPPVASIDWGVSISSTWGRHQPVTSCGRTGSISIGGCPWADSTPNMDLPFLSGSGFEGGIQDSERGLAGSMKIWVGRPKSNRGSTARFDLFVTPLCNRLIQLTPFRKPITLHQNGSTPFLREQVLPLDSQLPRLKKIHQ